MDPEREREKNNGKGNYILKENYILKYSILKPSDIDSSSEHELSDWKDLRNERTKICIKVHHKI